MCQSSSCVGLRKSHWSKLNKSGRGFWHGARIAGRHVHWVLCLLWVRVIASVCGAQCFQSAAPRAAGCIYREISGLPLPQWAPLVLGLSLSRQAGKPLCKQLSLSAPVTKRPSNCTECLGRGEQTGGSIWEKNNEIAILMTHLLNKRPGQGEDDCRLKGGLFY